jgi:hypothetical protein
MKLFRLRRTARGQGLVEFAIVLPLLMLLLVMAVDFGRVFFGSVGLHNAARIAADRAAQTPNAWPGSVGQDTIDQENYRSRTEADLEAVNCDYPPVPDPEFPVGKDDGDPAVVELRCTFHLLTPLAEIILGGPITLGAHSEFPIHRVVSTGIPAPPPPPPPCITTERRVPDMVGERLRDARDMWVAAGFASSSFTPAVVTTGPLAGRNGDRIVANQTTSPASAPGDCVTVSASVHMDLEP